MEGESLMNDGSSLVLFEVFLKLVRDLSKGGTGLDGSLLHTFGTMGMHIVWLSLGEAVCKGALASAVWQALVVPLALQNGAAALMAMQNAWLCLAQAGWCRQSTSNPCTSIYPAAQ